jgi:hypothetical protein
MSTYFNLILIYSVYTEECRGMLRKYMESAES